MIKVNKNMKHLMRVYIQPTDRCNLSCVFCWRNHNQSSQGELLKNELSDKKWLEIIEDSCKFGAIHFTITGGGEPLIRKKLFINILRTIEKNSIIKKNGIKCDITTNGTLIDENLLKNIMNLKLFICFSFHGLSEKTNDYLMGKKGTLKRILRAISLINFYKQKYNSKYYPNLANHFVITKNNYMEMQKMMEIAKEYKISHIGFRMLTPESSIAFPFLCLGKEDMKPFESQIRKVKKLARNYKKGLDFEFDINEIKKNLQGKKVKEKLKKVNKKFAYCLLPFFEIVIMSYGQANPCCTYQDISKAGFSDNIVKKRLIDVWDGKKFNTLRKLMISFDPPKKCLSCYQDTKTYREKVNYLKETKDIK